MCGCQVWATENTGERMLVQVPPVAKAKIANLTVQSLSEAEGAIGPCQAGAALLLVQYAFDWLDELLKSPLRSGVLKD